MFDTDAFVTECREARAEAEPRRAIREVLARAVARPAEVAGALQPRQGGLDLLYHAPDLTVLHVVWAPAMRLYPHDHRMWAAIAIYAGQEDNEFYRRDGRGLTESGGRSLAEGDVLVLGDDVVHAVANPKAGLTGAIHVYGGDFVAQPRSQWGPGPLEERPYDMAQVHEQFDRANRAWLAEP